MWLSKRRQKIDAQSSNGSYSLQTVAAAKHSWSVRFKLLHFGRSHEAFPRTVIPCLLFIIIVVHPIDYYVEAANRLALLHLLLQNHLYLPLRRAQDKVAEFFVHLLDLTVELVLYEQLLLRIPAFGYQHFGQILRNYLDQDGLFVLEGVEHWGIGERYLPIVIDQSCVLGRYFCVLSLL